MDYWSVVISMAIGNFVGTFAVGIAIPWISDIRKRKKE